VYDTMRRTLASMRRPDVKLDVLHQDTISPRFTV